MIPDSLLVMKRHGPYSVDDAAHMAMLVRNVLALMLELSDPMD